MYIDKNRNRRYGIAPQYFGQSTSFQVSICSSCLSSALMAFPHSGHSRDDLALQRVLESSFSIGKGLIYYFSRCEVSFFLMFLIWKWVVKIMIVDRSFVLKLYPYCQFIPLFI
jgi:hypothetical protein